MSTGTDTENALLALADAKVWLDSTGTTEYDGLINDCINEMSAVFNTECGRKLKARAYTEYYDGNGRSSLFLNNYPVTSTGVTVTIDETRAFTTDYQVTSTDVIVSTDKGLVRLDGWTFQAGTANVKVEYSAGYSTSDAFVLTRAAKDYLSWLWARYQKHIPVGVRTEGGEGGSRTYETDMPWSVKRVLEMFRDRRVP